MASVRFERTLSKGRMMLTAEEFVARVIAGDEPVAGMSVSGAVKIRNQQLKNTDWSGCRLDGPLTLIGCSSGPLTLRGASIDGRISIRDLAFTSGGLSMRGAICRGGVELIDINRSCARSHVFFQGDRGPDLTLEYSGLDLIGIEVSGGLTVTPKAGEFLGNAVCLDYARISGPTSIGEGHHNVANVFVSFAKLEGSLNIFLAHESNSTQFVIFERLECLGNVTVQLKEGESSKRIYGRASAVHGDLRIVAARDNGTHVIGKYECISIDGSRIDGTLQIVDMAPAQRSNGGSIAASSVHSGSVLIDQVEAESIRFYGCVVQRDVALSKVKTGDLDFYGLTATDITLLGVQQTPARQLTVDLRRARIANLVCVEGLVAKQLYLGYSMVGATRLISAQLEEFILRSTTVEQYVRVISSEIQRIEATSVRGAAALEVYDAACNGVDIKDARLADFAKNLRSDLRDCDPSEGRRCMRELWELRAISKINSIDLSGGSWSSVNLIHAYFDCTASSTDACVSAKGLRVSGALNAVASQFENSKRTALDLGDSVIEEVSFGGHLPTPLKFSAARIASWGIAREDAEGFMGVINASIEFDRAACIEFEQRLENSGKLSEADRFHVMWRRKEAGILPLWRRSVSSAHYHLLRYGTRSGQVLLYWSTIALIALLVVLRFYNTDFTPVSSHVFIDALQHVLRSSIPMIDLGLKPLGEVRAGTVSYWALLAVRLMGWVCWPLFLTSLVVKLLPKRHRA
ncbi:hypothetical protein [Stenotrophomonas maltophilia]|uniref:hypothetical protein n=1 Tax=Stenotrophomonas maltophilia TaxID=40324 RepID=UPI000A2FC65C|nr:hypothetical protein [Stenotrophomonas maltophilia]ARQ90052.1 hypothetical protein A7326_10760 [Stenotrophomonas maltophilia]